MAADNKTEGQQGRENMLILPIKKKWFDMLLSGEKKEEYREIKPYYETRFRNVWKGSLIGGNAQRQIMFRNGYSKDSPSLIAQCTLSVGAGKQEWGAEKDKQYFVLAIREILANTIKQEGSRT